ncbi:MAG TPA: oxygenase MpaB family protein [Anaerolineales bacterium]|nr:oxygenase MpaB family protein [Anaerolineales bacterium]
MGSTKTAKSAQPVPLGPDSLTWKYFGDLRTGMLGVWIGSLQNMYPQLGAGVEDHSILLREPLQRVARSVYPIMGVVYDGERARQTGEQIKGFHTSIKGVDAAGRRYHALDPETFYWAHATFFMLILKVAEYFCGGLTEAEKRQLFEEHVQWYRMYNMSMRPVPQTWEAFCEYWDRVCREDLEINRATRTELLKIPGFGVKAVEVILRQRRLNKFRDLGDLKKLGILADRAAPFILLDGHHPAQQLALF